MAAFHWQLVPTVWGSRPSSWCKVLNAMMDESQRHSDWLYPSFLSSSVGGLRKGGMGVIDGSASAGFISSDG